MAEMSRRFNFDDFDQLCAEALEEHRQTDAQLCLEGPRLAAVERNTELFDDGIIDDEIPLTMLGEHPTSFE